MTRRRLSLLAIPLVLAISAGFALGQRMRRGPLMETSEDRRGVPDWKVDDKFKNDVFTFVRIEYDDGMYGGGGRRGRGGYGGGFGGGYYRGGRWATDFPDSDLNFSYRLQQLTSLKVNPNPIHMRLTDERLFDYPFIYIIEPGALEFGEEEVVALRRYLLNGGFLMVDDFWGDDEYENFHQQIQPRLPRPRAERATARPRDLPLRLPTQGEAAGPQHRRWPRPGGTRGSPGNIATASDTSKVHYKGIFDDKGRMMVIICHNTDLGDGWEREGEDPWYFKEFSEKKAYPLGINIVTYAMTH